MSMGARDIFFMFSATYQIYLMLLCFDGLLTSRFSNTKHRFIQVAVVALMVAIMHITDYGNTFNFGFGLLVLLTFAAICGKIFYKSKVFSVTRPSTISIAIIYWAYVSVWTIIAAVLATLISEDGGAIASLTYDFADVSQMLVYIFVARFPILAGYIILKKRIKGQDAVNSSRFLYLVCASAIILIVTIFPLYSTFAYSEDLIDIISFLSNTVLLVVFSFTILSILYQRISLKGQKVQLDLTRLRNELLNQNLNDVKHLHQERGKLAHDMKEHLSVLYSLAKDESSEKLCAYIEKIYSPLKDIVRIENTGNEFLDTILTVKKQQAIKQGVAIDIDCDIIAPLNIEPVDLTAILSNLLENALEACEKVEDKNERYIFVDIKSQGAFLNIRIENSTNDTLIKQNKEMLTTKKNKELHGIGLKSVRSSVERYQGDIVFENQEGIFIVSIVLCLDL